MAPRKSVFNDEPREIAKTLITMPGTWLVVAEAPRESSRTLRSAAHRLKSRRFASFEKQAHGLDGHWDVTVRTEAAGDVSKMFARWIPKEQSA